MIPKTPADKAPHPNPFSLEMINRFYRKRGLRVDVITGPNLYVIHKEGKPWARIVYLPHKNEWFLDSWQPDSMIYAFWQNKRPCMYRLNCWCREKDRVKNLEEILKLTLELGD